MRTKRSPEDELDSEINRLASMSGAELDNELRRFGIDPQPTIERVKELIKQRLIAWSRTEKPE